MHIEVKYPDGQGLAKILEIYTKEFREASLIDDDVDLQEIGKYEFRNFDYYVQLNSVTSEQQCLTTRYI